MSYGPNYTNPNSAKKTSPLTALFAVLAVAGVVLVAFVCAFIAAQPKNGTLSHTPTGFTSYVSENSLFSCVYPSNWAFSSDTSDSPKGLPSLMPLPPPADVHIDDAEFSRGDMRISITADNMPQAFAQLAKTDPQMSSDSKSLFDLKGETEMDRMGVQASLQGYQEGKDKEFACPLGLGSDMDFTGDRVISDKETGPSGQVHGLIATIMGKNQTHVMVYCLCPQSEWTTGHEIFVRVINSLSPVK